ncbi:unnamed protein product [Brassicogethes aeneus]|uniref:Tyrosine-protein kinase receptor n=1 Tax=Brassicogethes aeneus TaxID=1431903 RepID=A0A9P0B041_BRAAE|nr:unnamed protein product [Brassicogethes aeneus]
MKLLCVVVLCLQLVSRSYANFEHLDSEIEYQCVSKCSLAPKSTETTHYDYACDFNCTIEQCKRGCILWRKALNSTCQNACYTGELDRLSQKIPHCVMGCNDAISKFHQRLKVQLGVPPAPALVADSLGATSLKLEWHFPDARREGLVCSVQVKLEEIDQWQYWSNVTWDSNENVVLIVNLQPYTKYRFRIAISILGFFMQYRIFSNQSVVISTAPHGLPTSPPNIDIPPDTQFYLFHNLHPQRQYNISISMRNTVGPGPAAITTITTPPERTIRDAKRPVLILGTESSIIEQEATITDDQDVLYKDNNHKFYGMGIHVQKKLLFISNSGGQIVKISLNRSTYPVEPAVVLDSTQINFQPLDLSVDWLNDQLYILAQASNNMYQILRCSLEGKGLTVAIAGLSVKPSSIEVDPCNGFLFWAIQDEVKGGLYKLDLADISNGIKHEIQPKMILSDSSLGAFLVDYSNFLLYVSYQEQNTIYKVSFDGKDKSNMRSKVTKSKMQKVISMAYTNKKFYWVDSNKLYFEEYNQIYESYFHNTIPSRTEHFYKKIFINQPSSQPTPVPVNPPSNVEAIFGCNLAKIKWQAPHLVGHQSLRGAWQNWTYEVSVTDVVRNSTQIIKNIMTTSYTIRNLQENTEYTINVTAYTSFGKSPASREFRGITLSESKKSMILWSATEGLLKSDAAGENVETLLHKNKINSINYIDVSWYKDKIYLVTNNSEVIWLNTTSHEQGILPDMYSVRGIAIDWIGRKIYWSNPKQPLIIRSNLNGGQKEHLPIYIVAKELSIDSVKAYLYWSTGYAVECSRLNGDDRIEYQEAQFFLGKQILGLTLDMDNKYVYWIIQGSEGSNLFKAPMAGYWPDKVIKAERVYTLKKPNIQGPLCYFHNRLIWLQDDKNAAISDLTGKNVATVSGKSISDLNMVYIIDSSLQTRPDNISGEIVVIPEAIDKDSIKVLGSTSSFNISWDPVENVNYGTVFYEVQIESFARKMNYSSMLTTDSFIKYWQKVEPHIKLHIGIRAYTYWASAPQVQAEIYSPSSTPSAPVNLRTYVTNDILHNSSEYDNIVSITFRWDSPVKPNGEIKGYKIQCWYVENDIEMNICENATTDASETEYKITDLVNNEVYYLQIQAFTDKGDGVLSEIISVNSSQEWPLPTLLIASSDSIFIDDIDADHRELLIHSINTPIEIAYLLKEKKIFWVNQMNELLMYDSSTNKTKNFDIRKMASGVTVDWLERSLYFVEILEKSSTINKIDLNRLDKNIIEVVPIYSTSSLISKIEISPYTKKLYWVETNDQLTHRLMKCDTNGENCAEFFNRHEINKRSTDDELCNCTINDIEPTFTVDHSNVNNKPLLIFIDKNKNIVSTDKEGCICNTIANNTVVSNYPMEKIKSDFGTLYWNNPSKNVLYALKRNETNVTSKRVNVHDVLIFGQHMQPYPRRECMTPIKLSNDQFKPALLRKTFSSFVLKMPEITVHPNCSYISIAPPEYKINYCTADVCNEILTFEKYYEIGDLKPFTEYTVTISVSNYFSQEDEIVVGPTVVYRTSPGAPSEPQNVSAIVLNPTLAEVNWLPPKELNGLKVYYEIHWQTERSLSGVRQKGEQPVLERNLKSNSSVMTTLLQKLSPNSTYIVWVKAYSETNETSSDSTRVQITTYPKPADLEMANKTANSFKLLWSKSTNMQEYRVEYSPITSNEWKLADISKKDKFITINNLKPKMQYKFRLQILYNKYPEWYLWPIDSRFTFETLGDRPSPPGIPIIQYAKPNVYKVLWEAAKDNGAPIEIYMLEGMKIKTYRDKRSTTNTNRSAWFYTAPSIEEEERQWESLYNGTNTSWIIKGLSDKFKYSFRVSALNSYGWSNPSKESMEFDFTEAARWAEKQNPESLILIAIGIPFIIVMCYVFCILYTYVRKCSKPKKVQQVVAIPRGPDVELATLRELPRRGVHSTNILYVSTQPPSEEITLLPHIRRDQITLTKFLGSGAFGEVYEGKAKGILSSSKETKVAVKTLRKGASDQEKTEFLQEAQLMSHFKHEHILQLLGVCLDNDPNFIIMELMQGGDLLTYLRSSRNPSSLTPNLTLIELLKMCVDVSKGCRYLEEMHFVHRDLACRNCLVSSVETDTRIVKIGDFGLARDIYKNDYYRKEGEGLLPVRWMAPESLVDGVFTSQSDVWAFGVLLWEIMTLGQQPYPARNNLEVLHYVRSGGRLGKPTDCPEDLHNLMLKCWEYIPDKRPTFKYALEVLVNLHQDNLRNPITGAHEGQYISTVPDRTSWHHESEDESLRPFLADGESSEPPKYLELIYESRVQLENDGYEIPNQLVQNGLENSTTLSSLLNVTNDGSTNEKDNILAMDGNTAF